jgi:hypothetical protein
MSKFKYAQKFTKENNDLSDIILTKDSEWSMIDGELCKVIDFVPHTSIRDGKISKLDKTMPYASVTIECKKIPNKITGFITHKTDFMHLWTAFKERTIKQNEEVIIFWSKKHLKSFAKIFSAFMPRLWVMICQKGAFELMTDPSYKSELQGEARYKAEKSIVEWKPEIME